MAAGDVSLTFTISTPTTLVSGGHAGRFAAGQRGEAARTSGHPVDDDEGSPAQETNGQTSRGQTGTVS